MSRQYQIWDKKSPIMTPVGNEYTAEEWLAKYPWARREGAHMIITKGTINGGRADNLDLIRSMYEQRGCTFDEGLTPSQILDVMEAFDQAEQDFNEVQNTVVPDVPTTEERIAAAMEAQLMLMGADVADSSDADDDEPAVSEVPAVVGRLNLLQNSKAAAVNRAAQKIAKTGQRTASAEDFMTQEILEAVPETTESAAFQRVRRNAKMGLWNATMVRVAQKRKLITSEEVTKILSELK